MEKPGCKGNGNWRRRLAFGGVLAVGWAWPLPAQAGPSDRPLTQDVYVWQRAWNEPVLEAVRDRAPRFAKVIVLAAEVTWPGNPPRVVRIQTDWEALRRTGAAVGLALRIGPVPGDFGYADGRSKWLAELSRSLLDEASRHAVAACELQIDFDCAESKLAHYVAWVEAIRNHVSPTPVVITALPTWLTRPEFQRLAEAADEFVLQVHSLERPTGPDAAFTLCDVAAARQAIERAGRFGKGFRVALPTYGYVIAFDTQGNYAGLSAEGPRRNWPADWQLREVRADPAAMAGLVRGWTSQRPDHLRGIIWYRMPVEGDVLNWSWPTLARVMAGTAPQAKLRAEARRVQPGLVEFDLVNEGDADFEGQAEVEARWTGTRPLASDGLRGFEPVPTGTNRICFRHPRQPSRISPQERRMIGWLRLADDLPVTCEIRGTNHDPAK
jgi:hypothetical protein